MPARSSIEGFRFAPWCGARTSGRPPLRAEGIEVVVGYNRTG